MTDNRYYIVRYTSSHLSQRYKYFNSTDLNCMIDDLKPHTQYEFTVKVVKVSHRPIGLTVTFSEQEVILSFLSKLGSQTESMEYGSF